MSFLSPTTPVCSSSTHHHQHLTLGQACLQVSSTSSNSLQLWAQSKECYKCPPWYYLNLSPNTTQSLVVNTTYPTEIYMTTEDGSDLYSLSYHFEEYGEYHLMVNSHKANTLEVTKQPENEYLPLLTATLFFVLLAFMWQCAKFLLVRMDSSLPHMQRSGSEDDTDHLIQRQDHQQQQQQRPTLTTSYSLNSQPSTSSHLPTSSPVESETPPPSAVPDSRRSQRLKSLDAFRGLAIVLMIFVNYGGGQYSFFRHARWNGLTVADLVFPWFMWIMGVSLVFSIRSQLRQTTRRIVIVLRILKRCVVLFALGIIVNSVGGHNYMPSFRILGVLQRFSLCYFLTAVIEVYAMNPQESPEYVWYWKIRDLVRSSPQWLYTLTLVTLQVALTFGLSVPGCPMGYLGPGGLHEWGMYKGCTGGAAGYIDTLVLGRAHVYSHPTCTTVYDSHTPYDPEGLLGVLTSVLMVQFGCACGRIIITYQNHKERLARWVVWAVLTGLMSGFLCGWRKEGGLIPVNKNLWSLSYVLCTACFAFILFSLLYLMIDGGDLWNGNPLRYAGMNAILLYVGHEVCGDLLPWSWKPVGQHHTNHLVMNIWGTCAWIIIAYVLHLKKMYFSV